MPYNYKLLYCTPLTLLFNLFFITTGASELLAITSAILICIGSISRAGTIYTARDAAHKRMAEALERKEQLPIDMKNNIIYYMGPSPAREQRPIGSAGPTTASRMDKYAPDLLDLGLKGMIGKGKRSKAVIDAIVRNGAVYFAAVGGAGAILSKCIKKSTVIAYDDLGTEAIRELEVENFPVVVVIDSEGNNLYETAIKEYRKE